MKKAISFLVVSIVMYLLSSGITELFNFGATYKTIGIIAIISGFIFLIYPLETLLFLGLFPKLPIWILILAIGISFGGVLISICLLEIWLPLALGYILISSLSLPEFSYMIGIIIYLTVWIGLRKQYIKIISNTWDYGAKLIERSVKPFYKMRDRIDSYIDVVYNWVRTDK
jgi:hypothetical protein